MDPLELLEKLSALEPAPRVHLVRYSGVLAPAAKWRPLIVPACPAKESAPAISFACATETSGCATESFTAASVAVSPGPQFPATRHGRNYTWAELMKRVFEIDVLECPRCLGRMRIVAAIHPPDATRKILDCLGLPSRAPPIATTVSQHRLQLE